jgi:nickel-dependent lactate racemase
LGNIPYNIPSLLWYENKQIELWFPERWKTYFLHMNGYYKKKITGKDIKNVLRHPLGTKSLKKLAIDKKECIIVVDDMTRPTKASQIIPYIIDELVSAGFSNDRIRFVMGGGVHGAWYRQDFSKKVGEDIVRNYPMYNHNPFTSCEKVGETTYGTPLEINNEYKECDLRIGIGSVVPHPEAGYSGGSKIILPGISSYKTIYHHHMIVHSKNPLPKNRSSYFGYLKGNLFRNNIEEAGNIVGMDMKIDVLVNGFGDSCAVFSGQLQDEFYSAVDVAKNHYSTPNFPEQVDVIVANTYTKANEATLALMNWSYKLKKDGIMVIIAHTPEGQTTHYLSGKFGTNKNTPDGLHPKEIKFRKLILFSKYKTPDPLLPITESEIIWIDSWKEVIEEIKSSFQYLPKVAVLPSSEIQCEKKTLMAI